MRVRLALLACTLLPCTGCSRPGEWVPTLWGGPILDDARAPESAGRFTSDDGCEVTIHSFVVSLRTGALLTPAGTASAVFSGEQLFDLARPGPHSAASVVLPAGEYPETVWITGPSLEPGPSTLVGRGALLGTDNAANDANPALGNAEADQRDAMIAAGAAALLDATVMCGENTVTVSLLIDDLDALLRCPHDGFAVPGGSFGATRIEVRGETLLATSALFPPADADADGVLTILELDGAVGGAFPDDATDAETEGLDPARAGDHLRLALRRAWRSESASCAWELLPPS